MNNIRKFLVGLLSMVLLVGLTLPFSSASAEEVENAGDNQTTPEIPEVLKPIDISDLKYDVNKNLSEEQIAERFDWINSNYEINQPFSLEDTEFIRAYASPLRQMPLLIMVGFQHMI